MNVNKNTVIWGLAGIAGAYVLGKVIVKDAADEVGAVAADVGNAINPTNRNNIFYRGVNSIGAALTGKDDFNLGVWTYDILHPDEVARLTQPVEIVNRPPPEASVTPGFRWQVGQQPGQSAPVTKSETGNIDYVTW